MRIIAYNFYGASDESEDTSVAIVLTVPSSPVDLLDNMSSASIISFTWSNGVSTGGSPIIDYRISWD